MPLPARKTMSIDRRARLGGQLIRLANRYDRALSERLARWNLAPTHYEILKALYAAPDYSLTHSRLAEAAGVTLPSITLAVRKLGAMRMIGAQRGEDRRSRIATLTVKGAETLALLFDQHEKFAEAVFTSLNHSGADNLEKSIQRLLSRLTEIGDQAVASAA